MARGKGHGNGPKGVTTEKAKDFNGTIKKLWSYLSKYKVALIIVVILTIASTIFSVVGPKILGNATTELFNGVISKKVIYKELLASEHLTTNGTSCTGFLFVLSGDIE